MKKIIYSDVAPKPLGVYSQGTVGGGLIFVSGQVPVDPKTSKFIEQDIKKQTRQVFLLNINDFKGMNEVFQEFFPVEPPARTTITVKAFPPGVLVEIDAIALKP